MKLSIFTVCLLISSMHYSVQGGLVKDFFGKVKETADTVHKDVKQIWRPESDTNNKNTDHGDQTVTTPETVTTPNAAKDDAPGKKEDSKVSEKIPDVDQNTPDASTTSTSTTVATEVKENKVDETSTVSYSTTTKKEERAVLSGGCQAGYKRTENGRCMATY